MSLFCRRELVTRHGTALLPLASTATPQPTIVFLCNRRRPQTTNARGTAVHGQQFTRYINCLLPVAGWQKLTGALQSIYYDKTPRCCRFYYESMFSFSIWFTFYLFILLTSVMPQRTAVLLVVVPEPSIFSLHLVMTGHANMLENCGKYTH